MARYFVEDEREERFKERLEQIALILGMEIDVEKEEFVEVADEIATAISKLKIQPTPEQAEQRKKEIEEKFF